MATAGYVMIGKVAPRIFLDAANGQTMMAALFWLLSLSWAMVFGLGGVISFVRSVQYRQLLRGQQSVQNIRGLHWKDFERLLAAYYVQKGYVVDVTGGGGADGGIDLVLTRPGEKVLVQAKNWRTSSVSVGVVREMRGLMAAHSATGGVVVSSGAFTKEALKFGRDHGVQLVDGQTLAGMVRGVNGGDGVVQSTACPQCGSAMSVRFNRKDRNEFLGCSQFPRCKGTRAIAPAG